MTTMKCGGCQLWQKSPKGSVGWRDNLGRCNNVPNFFDATKEVDEYDPEEGYAADRKLKPEYESVKAFGLDATGNEAYLVTASDFGCLAFKPAGVQAAEEIAAQKSALQLTKNS